MFKLGAKKQTLTFADLICFYNRLYISKMSVKSAQVGETKINMYFRSIT